MFQCYYNYIRGRKRVDPRAATQELLAVPGDGVWISNVSVLQ